MTFLLWIGLIILLVIIAYLAVGAVAASTLTKVGEHPQYTGDPAAFGIEYEVVTFPSRVDRLNIAGWYLPKPGATRAIILVHGRDASKQNAISGKFPQLAAELHTAGLAVLMMDLRGHGESAGKRYTFGVHERRDVLGAVDFLLQYGFEAGQIAALGISLGSAAVIGAAAEDTAIGALIAESAFADINLLIQPKWKAESGLPFLFLPGVFWMWRVLMGFDLRTVKPVEELVRVPPRPVLILHAWSDETVDVQHAYALKNAIPEAELVIFDHCEHAELFRDQPGAYLQALIPFLQDRWKN
ncbi:MAG: alpha/beta hydrolase [Brevefilum sp.]